MVTKFSGAAGIFADGDYNMESLAANKWCVLKVPKKPSEMGIVKGIRIFD